MATASASVSADSLAACLLKQKTEGVLVSNERDSGASGATSTRLNISLVNATTSNTVYAYITGLSINNNNAVWLLEADGVTDYFPTSPASVGTALANNCAIPLAAPNEAITVSIPQIAGGRIWFSIDSQLTFLLNPGPALVEPSVTNASDPNINNQWDFCEFTYNSSEMFANISYVDFVCLPIALDIAGSDGSTQHVSGMTTDGLDSVCTALIQQSATDGSDWSSLIVKDTGGNNLRAISPNNAMIINSALFDNYYEDYVNEVWTTYSSTSLNIDTQASYGTVAGQVTSDVLTFPGDITFAKPTTGDIFSNSTGPFATGDNAEVNAIIPRLAAAFNRSTILTNANQPDNEVVSNFYQTSPTNHYSRICHSVNLDTLGYGFPYDDVAPTSLSGVSGAVANGTPTLLTVTVGGAGAYSSPTTIAKSRRRRNLESLTPTPTLTQPSQGYIMQNITDEKAALKSPETIDIELGQKFPENWQTNHPSRLRNAMPPVLRRAYEKMAPQLDPLFNNSYLSKTFDFLNSATSSILSASVRAFISRVILAVLVLLFYMTIELFNKTGQKSMEGGPSQ